MSASASSAKSEMNDIELSGETDDEVVKDGETRFDDGDAPVRNISDPGHPTGSEHRENMNTHRPCSSWCKFGVVGRGVFSPHRRSDAQDELEGVLHVSVDFGLFGEKKSEKQVSTVLVVREKGNQIAWAMLVP